MGVKKRKKVGLWQKVNPPATVGVELPMMDLYVTRPRAPLPPGYIFLTYGTLPRASPYKGYLDGDICYMSKFKGLVEVYGKLW